MLMFICFRHNIQANYFGEDLSTEDGNTALCDHIYQIYPRGVDILVNNAGELLL
jgi:NAD(P)-dependent dehydrogenase (short-subunit alcohol dehydrogenase family)